MFTIHVKIEVYFRSKLDREIIIYLGHQYIMANTFYLGISFWMTDLFLINFKKSNNLGTCNIIN